MITAEQAFLISDKYMSEGDKVLLDNTSNLIQQEAERGKFQLVYQTSGPITSGPCCVTRELNRHGFRVRRRLGEEGYTFLIDWN